jgi:nucleotide-binding universal stress UspA family protein
MLRGKGWKVGVQVIAGSLAASIASVARQQSVDLIAMATHGRSGFARLVLGSVAAETLQRATTPVLVLRPAGLADSSSTDPTAIDAQELAHRFTILVALDVTDKADAALAPTASLARAMGARVVLVNVFRPATDMSHVQAPTTAAVEYVRTERRLYLEDKSRQLTGIDVETRVEVLSHGEEIDHRIAAVAAEIAADMVVVVSERVSNAAGLVIGSVAQGIVRHSPCPVLIVSPTAITASEVQELRLPLCVSNPT